MMLYNDARQVCGPGEQSTDGLVVGAGSVGLRLLVRHADARDASPDGCQAPAAPRSRAQRGACPRASCLLSCLRGATDRYPRY